MRGFGRFFAKTARRRTDNRFKTIGGTERESGKTPQNRRAERAAKRGKRAPGGVLLYVAAGADLTSGAFERGKKKRRSGVGHGILKL